MLSQHCFALLDFFCVTLLFLLYLCLFHGVALFFLNPRYLVRL